MRRSAARRRSRRASVAAGACCAVALLYGALPSRARAARPPGKEAGAPKARAAASDAGALARRDARESDAEAAEAAESADETEDDEAQTAGGASDAAAPSARRKPPAALEAQDGGEPAEEDEDEGGLGAEVDVASRFVWRGMAFSDGPVLQPSVWGEVHGLAIEIWTNVLLSYEGPRDRISAIVPAASYTLTFGRVKLEPGAVLYDTPGERGPRLTSEATLNAAYEVVDDLHLAVGTYVDVQASPGAYFGTLGAEYERTWKKWTLKPLVEVGWASGLFNRDYFDVDQAAINMVHASVSIRYNVTDFFYGSLHGEVSTLLSPALRDSVEQPTLGAAGIAVGLQY